MKIVYKKALAALVCLGLVVPTFIEGGFYRANASTHNNIISFARPDGTNLYTSGYTFSTVNTKTATGYLLDNSTVTTTSLTLYSKTTPLFATTPTAVSFKAKIGGGTGNTNLYKGEPGQEGYEDYAVYVCYVDSAGAEIEGTTSLVTNHIADDAGNDYNVSMDLSHAESAYGIKLFHLKKSGYNVRYYNFSVSYTDALSVPVVSITSPSNYTKVGDTIQFSETHENFDNPGATQWISSDTEVATINSSGLLTGVAMGTTNITASIDETNSNSIAIKVYPSNQNQIDVETALAIAEFAGSTNTPYDYVCTANVKSVTSASNFVITQNDHDITVYKSSHGLTADDVGRQVKISGKLVNYNDTTKEFTSVTIDKYYSVTFNYNGNGTANSVLEHVFHGTTINAPEEPSWAGHTFHGWYNNENEWDFANDVVNSDITLTASWVEDTSYGTFITLNTRASLAVEYDRHLGASTTVTAQYTSDSTTNMTGVSSTDATSISLDPETFDVFATKTSGNLPGLNKSGQIRIYSASQIRFAVKNYAHSISRVVVTYAQGGNYESPLMVGSKVYEAVVTNTYVRTYDLPHVYEFTLAAPSSTNYITSIAITYSAEEAPTINQIGIRFGVLFDKEDYDNMIADGATFGVAFVKNYQGAFDIETATKVNCTPVRVNSTGKLADENGPKYQYAVLIRNVPNDKINEVFYAVCYCKIGDTYHVMNSTQYSVKTLAAQYLTSDFAEYAGHLKVISVLAA